MNYDKKQGTLKKQQPSKETLLRQSSTLKQQSTGKIIQQPRRPEEHRGSKRK